MVRFFYKMQPFHSKYSKESFRTELSSDEGRQNGKSFCLIIVASGLVYIVLNNIEFIKMQMEKRFYIELFENANSFIGDYKWIIITLVSVLVLLHRYLRSKFIDPIVLSIQEKELEKVILTHMDMLRDFVELYGLLCDNINRFLHSSKEKKDMFIIYRSMEEKYGKFEYDTIEHSFKVKKKNTSKNDWYKSKGYSYKNITEVTSRLKEKNSEFKKLKPYYNTMAINKYAKGLKGFDITRSALYKNEENLLCEELVKEICDTYPSSLNCISEEIIDNPYVIAEMNRVMKNKSDRMINVALETIEYVVDLDIYIRNLKKLFALKSRREETPTQAILEQLRGK